MVDLVAFELLGLLLGLACLPNWLVARWYAAHGSRPALRRSHFINCVLALVGLALMAGALALEMRHAKPLLTYAFGLLGIVGLLVSVVLHTFDKD